MSIWKWGNTVHITKMGIEGTVALASLAAAITTVLIAANIVAAPESLALIITIVDPIGIAALFLIAVYFATLAYCSYKKMHKNEEINGAETSGNVGETKVTIENVRKEIEVKTANLATQADLDKKDDKGEIISTVLDGLSEDSVQQQFKQSLGLQEKVA
ncbi:hypothetical protein HET73_00490 [Wolbachia endosymbiont of Atemnus politus]|uniref:hypothetical protein n=1 Tax=Wolbachia endosymbiont of Atemnus politus TaxID=2682840 RepID=UPI001573F48F|nr:hypothetical protein [Wolbachia endosymbiont of Atemnus politus]NSM56188.1 hypothetical protein [Wolbachia endosymbiont of Atemnus politus]